MTELKSDGGPAFPHQFTDLRGMSLLDWYAGLAMQGMMRDINPFSGGLIPDTSIARAAYEIADAMIEQRGYWIARRHKQEEQP